MGLPVAYEARTYAFKPWPAIELSRVKIQTAQPIELGKAWVTPDYADWILQQSTRNVRVDTDEIVARPASLARLGIADGPSTRHITRMTFGRMKLRFGAGFIELPAGVMEFAPNGTLSRVRITQDRLQLELSPKNGELAVLVQASGLSWAAFPAFKFESVVAQGTMGDERIVLDKIGANSDGGSITGELRLQSGDQLALQGELALKGARAKDLLERLYPRHTVDGTLNADMKVESSGASIETLGAMTSVTGTYTLRTGSVDKFGLLEGLRRSTPGVAGGGLLRFEAISGRFAGVTGKPRTVTFQGLDAGALKSSGSFSVSPEGALKGSIHGTLQSPGGEVNSRNLQLSGNTTSPILSVRE